MTDQPFRVKLEAIAYAEESPTDRQALHVQGLSYWAPANIGPYSQAVVLHDQRVFISGQIGLLPYNLTLPTPQNLPLETALACQHVERISRALKTNSGGGWEGHVQLAVYWLQNYDDVAVVREAVQDLHGSAPTLFIGVPALPKGALVEKQVVIHTGRFLMCDEEGDEEVRLLKPVETSGQISSATSDFTISWARSTFVNGSSSITVIYLRGQIDDSVEASLSEALPDLWDNTLLVRVFYRPSESLEYPDFMLRHNNLPTSSIPCKFVSAAGHDDWDLAICIMGV